MLLVVDNLMVKNENGGNDLAWAVYTSKRGADKMRKDQYFTLETFKMHIYASILKLEIFHLTSHRFMDLTHKRKHR